jgi:peptide deformylase
MPRSLNFSGTNINLLKSAVRVFKVYINPKIMSQSDNKVMMPENCLSVGSDVYAVYRTESITVEYYNTEGERIEEKLTGIRARVFLH